MSGSGWERKLVNASVDRGYGVMRAGASGGGTDKNRPDVLIGQPVDGVFPPYSEAYAVEHKYKRSSKYTYLTREEVDRLKQFADAFGARALIGCRWSTRLDCLSKSENATWYFGYPDMLNDVSDEKVGITATQAVDEWIPYDEMFPDIS